MAEILVAVEVSFFPIDFETLVLNISASVPGSYGGGGGDSGYGNSGGGGGDYGGNSGGGGG